MSVYGGITNQVVERAGLPRDDTALFLASLVFNFAVAVVIFLLFGGHRTGRRVDRDAQAVAELDRPGVAVPLRGHGGTPAAIQMRAAEGAEPEPQHPGLNSHRALTLMGLVALGVGSLAFELNVGLVAISIAVLLALLSPNAQKGAVDQVSWSTVLLITGAVPASRPRSGSRRSCGDRGLVNDR
jgi:Na+/H+ antiporter NhaD/arsenite permease-like protein